MFPSFYFMKHDRWAHVLFLHWRVPDELQGILEEHVSPFALDRASDGSVWIGLILLTEQHVGLSILPRIAPWNSFTHHGVNVRAYVRCQHHDEGGGGMPGIHFSSLECDHRFVAHMASYFGMPYRMATISRRYVQMAPSSRVRDDDDDDDASAEPKTTACDDDDVAIAAHTEVKRFRIRSVRSPGRNSLLHVLLSSLWDKKPMHSTKLLGDDGQDPNANRTTSTGGKDKSTTFTVECDWERCHGPPPDPELTAFFVERYHAYTYKYACRLRGDVHHGPWPVETATLHRLCISNISSYEPTSMQPIIQYMASHAPDSVLYSPGVGPIDFKMLRPV